MGNVTAPSQGLGGQYNYFLYSNCAPVMDLSVIVHVTQDIVADVGLTIQLNADSPAGAPGAYQQFVFAIAGTGAATTIDCRTDYFTPPRNDHVSSYVSLITLPDQGAALPTLPAGYQLLIEMTNDSAGNILAATFLVVDPNGQAQSSGPIEPLGVPTPISAFEINIVGPAKEGPAFLTSGAGTITYVATSQLTVLGSLNGLPKNCISAHLTTDEQANTSYGGLPAGPYLPSNPINQTFTAVCKPWQQLDNNPACVAIAADGRDFYELHNDGSIWKYVGPPMTGWQQLDNNPACTAIAASGGNLYELHNDGSIWKYVGPPMTGWNKLDNNPKCLAITASGDNLYELHKDGSIWKYVGPPMTGWQELDNNPTCIAIAATGGNLNELHKDGSIWEYIGPPMTGWNKLDNNPACVAITEGGDTIYQLHKDGGIWAYLNI
jgi:hypothetical protein